MKLTKMMRKLGEKVSTVSIDPLCYPKFAYQPKPPASIQEKMQENK